MTDYVNIKNDKMAFSFDGGFFGTKSRKLQPESRRLNFYRRCSNNSEIFSLINIKVSFFWDPSQEMNLWIVSPPKKQASDWMTYLVYQFKTCFYWRKALELISWCLISQKPTLSMFTQLYHRIRTSGSVLDWKFQFLYVMIIDKHLEIGWI